jgi:hypothetical protein
VQDGFTTKSFHAATSSAGDVPGRRRYVVMGMD